MGASPDNLEMIGAEYRNGNLPRVGAVIDIGCQQLHNGDAGDVAKFFAAFDHVASRAALDKLAKRPPAPFIGPMFVELGWSYLSLDIVEAPMCEIFDLNLDTPRPALLGTADLVLNFGTTEHVMNQYNAFKVMHDLAKPGGLIYSFFIRGGPDYRDHGVVHYTLHFIGLLSQANSYKTVWHSHSDRPDGSKCSWVIWQKTSNQPFKALVDAEEGEGKPPLVATAVS